MLARVLWRRRARIRHNLLRCLLACVVDDLAALLAGGQLDLVDPVTELGPFWIVVAIRAVSSELVSMGVYRGCARAKRTLVHPGQS